jgi:hypothetical protein
MRGLLVTLTALVLLGGTVGCCTCGVCDCDHYTPCAGGCCTTDSVGPAAVVVQDTGKTPAKAPDKE